MHDTIFFCIKCYDGVSGKPMVRSGTQISLPWRSKTALIRLLRKPLASHMGWQLPTKICTVHKPELQHVPRTYIPRLANTMAAELRKVIHIRSTAPFKGWFRIRKHEALKGEKGQIISQTLKVIGPRVTTSIYPCQSDQ